jgi:hypothetical protein
MNKCYKDVEVDAVIHAQCIKLIDSVTRKLNYGDCDISGRLCKLGKLAALTKIQQPDIARLNEEPMVE